MDEELPADSADMKNRFIKLFNSISTRQKFVPNEDGGLLRCFSYLQLATMILPEDENQSEDIAEATIEALQNFFITRKFPFWFDMRSMYCLLGILKLSNRMNKVSREIREWLIEWICDSQSVLGGFGANPKAEAHGGYTFCAVSSLLILEQPNIPRKDLLMAWCQSRLGPRFNGRPSKPSDSCYIWWICGTLNNFGHDEIIDQKSEKIEKILWEHFYVDNSGGGGFGKYPSVPIPGDPSSVHGKQDADLFHTFLAICSLALFRNKIDSVLVLPLTR